MPSFYTLPVELLYEIFIFAHSEHFPHTSKHLYLVFKSTPSSIQAEYIISKYFADPSRDFSGLITRALRYPICTQPVLEALLRISESCNIINSNNAIELPRRLFRSLTPKFAFNRPRKGDQRDKHPHLQEDSSRWTSEDYPLPFLQYIYNEPRLSEPYTNSWDGYALTKAVAVGFVPLVKFLLENGASPACKNGLAVMVAIGRKDLALVKMLIERDGTVRLNSSPPVTQSKDETGSEGGHLGKRKGDDLKSSVDNGGRQKSFKKRRLQDRMKVNQGMLKTAVRCDARDVVKYLVEEKGCVPDMQTVLMMSS